MTRKYAPPARAPFLSTRWNSAGLSRRLSRPKHRIAADPCKAACVKGSGRREALATFRAAGTDHGAATTGRHTGAESVRALAAQGIGLECTFHGLILCSTRLWDLPRPTLPWWTSDASTSCPSATEIVALRRNAGDPFDRIPLERLPGSARNRTDAATARYLDQATAGRVIRQYIDAIGTKPFRTRLGNQTLLAADRGHCAVCYWCWRHRRARCGQSRAGWPATGHCR